ncbi:MAG TPA: cyclase family protein [Flavobacteriaceae bacterium]|jgi:kynurenine formamidase|nr:cyclase family protein [Flavobacteriaceae bacterium]HIN98083.1 cyclase family protein [Flavobacteriaceae bacterium]|tara:strand:+ start:58936 stop:59682 length:747 start_codon:yes stop_codon:yes gene_type:complete
MRATFNLGGTLKIIDLNAPIDLSISLRDSEENPLAWYLGKPEISPVKLDNWVGKVSEGASVNFNTINFNPHAHGTHTECVGHISEEFYSVNDALTNFFFTAEVISVTPAAFGDDLIISLEQLKQLLGDNRPEAVVVRTLPNTDAKRSKHYSNTNWPYLHEKAANFLREIGVAHLLIDLPSVDKEKDEGKLLAHKAFWNYPEQPRYNATITEFIYVPYDVKDGSYLLNLQMAAFSNDAAPSRPVLYKFI